ncbi:MFS transporter [Arhodomonas aquaeolei]|uniref:MFS transporter n=1 Tax=Arhodomonas aquaeolei TaxID=2369 RepID=UPI002168A061|nr:MFS transporter [Arhodomonas aquaeolei]MCS4505937.1 MFS transporter [Arhodomonas aquaeolei]
MNRRAVTAWALYDWANSAFATVVIAGFFPLLFQDYWSTDVGPAASNLRLGGASAVASLMLIAVAPLLGAMADRLGARKRLLFTFAVPGMLATAALAWVPGGAWMSAAALYVCASVGFMGANVFYDALLVNVAPPSRWDAVSGLGYGLGYLGGGLLYLGCVLAALNPSALGFADAGAAARAGFVATAVWWGVFALPLARRVPERRRHPEAGAWQAGWRELAGTLRHLSAVRPVLVFLLAYWLYIDAVHTVIRMAVAYGRALGFGRDDLIVALLVVQFVGFPAAILYGRLGERWGPRRGIYAGLLVYAAICVWGAFIESAWEFYVIAVLVGLVQGGVQALSRSLYARLIPPGRAGEFFGFYNLLGKFAAVLGPPLFGVFGTVFGSVRFSMLSLIVLFAAGAAVLARVPESAFRAGDGS